MCPLAVRHRCVLIIPVLFPPNTTNILAVCAVPFARLLLRRLYSSRCTSAASSVRVVVTILCVQHFPAECVRHSCPDPTLSGIFLPTMRRHRPVLSRHVAWGCCMLWTVWSSVEKTRFLFKITSKQIACLSGVPESQFDFREKRSRWNNSRKSTFGFVRKCPP